MILESPPLETFSSCLVWAILVFHTILRSQKRKWVTSNNFIEMIYAKYVLFVFLRPDSRMDREPTKEENHQRPFWRVWAWLHPGCRGWPESKHVTRLTVHNVKWMHHVLQYSVHTCMYLENVCFHCQAAEKVGYPVMVKASEGGGGKGIRKVNSVDDFPNLFRQVSGNSRLNPVFFLKPHSGLNSL